MSELTGNKIFGAALGTALVVAGLFVVIPMVFEKTPPAHPGYAITVAAEQAGGGAAEVADVPPDWGTVLKTADVAAGEAKTAACKSCHSFDAAGANNIGPGLYGVLGRKPGSHPGFAYSSAMTDFAGKTPVWDFQHVYEFIKGPQNYLSGTKMTFVGIKAPQDRINVIAYLHTLGSNLPIPAPNPKAAAAAPAAAAPAAAPAAAKPGESAPTPAAKTAPAG